MKLLLYGNDPFLVHRRRRVLQDAFLKKYTEGETHLFDFEDQGAEASVREAFALAEQDLFSAPKMIVFLHPASLKDAPAKAFLELLEEKGQGDAMLLFVQPGNFRKNDKTIAAIRRSVEKEELLDTPAGPKLDAWVRKELARIDPQASIGNEALQDLIRATKGELPRLSSEAEKLALFAEAREITALDVETLVEFSKEDVIFQALDALSRGDRAQALLLFRAQETASDIARQLLSMCAWQVRRLILVRECFDRGQRASSDVAAYAGLRPFAAEKALRIIHTFPEARLRRGLSFLSDLDTCLKLGTTDPGVALNLFVWKF